MQLKVYKGIILIIEKIIKFIFKIEPNQSFVAAVVVVVVAENYWQNVMMELEQNLRNHYPTLRKLDFYQL